MAQMRVFVSHSSQDTPFCDALVAELRRAGADVWYDEHSLGPSPLIDTIEVELRSRPVFVLALSPAALQSQWVRNETKWAFQLFQRDPSRIILPVLAGAVEENDIWLFLQDFKRVETRGIKPYPWTEAIAHTLHELQLAPSGQAPALVALLPAETTGSANSLLMQGKALQAQQRYTEALPLFERAAQLAPRSFDAWFNIGVSRNMLHQYAEALPVFDQALALDPKSAAAWKNKGDSFSGFRHLDEALVAYEQAAALDAQDAAAWCQLSTALFRLFRYAEALDAADRGIENSATLWQAWWAKARALRALGRVAEAQAAERRAKELGG